MLQKESVKNRMEAGISFTEFAYMLVQAYDYWHLNRHRRRRAADGRQRPVGQHHGRHRADPPARGQEQAHGLVLPLLTTATGAKFGKSEEGNVWLDAGKTSPYKFYQFWLNADDRDVGSWLRIFTFLPLEEIDALLAEHAAEPGRRAAQRRLAREVTATVHGAESPSGSSRRVRSCSVAPTSGRRKRRRARGARGGGADRSGLPRRCSRKGLPVVDALVQVGPRQFQGRRDAEACSSGGSR